MYQPSCEDIGAYLYVTVTPLEAAEGYSGVAEAKYGPVAMESNLRKALESVLVSGGTKFSCALTTCDDSGPNTQDALLTVSRDLIDLKLLDRDGSADSIAYFSQAYSIDSPKLILAPDTRKLSIELTGKPTKLTLRCMSRQSRDLIVLTIRCLAMRNYLVHTKALQEVFQTDNMQVLPNENHSSLDLALELEASIRETQNLVSLNEATVLEKNRLKRELMELEDSINETIGAYQGLLANEERMSSSTAKEDELERLQHKLDSAITSKHKLRQKLAKTKEELELVRQETERSRVEDHEIPASVNAYIKDIEAQLQAAKEELGRVGNESDSWSTEISVARESNHELKAQLRKLEKKYSTAKANASNNEALLKLKAENEHLKQDNEALLGQRSLMSKKLEALNAHVAELTTELDDTKTALERARLRVEQDNETLMAHLSSPVKADQDSAVHDLEHELAKYRNQCDSLAAQLSRAQAASRRQIR